MTPYAHPVTRYNLTIGTALRQGAGWVMPASKPFAMPLTPAMIKAAFQDSMPNRRRDFAKELKALRVTLVAQGVDRQTYASAIFDLSAAELRERIETAAERVKQLIRSGWTADQMNTVRKAFLDCFGTWSTLDKDPQSDLYNAVDFTSFSSPAGGLPAHALTPHGGLSRVQVDTAEACLTDLDVYYGELHPDAPASSPAQDKAAVIQSVEQTDADRKGQQQAAFVHLLHPAVIDASRRHYEDGDFRNAVLDAMLVLTERIRERSGKDGDGVALVSSVFKPESPILTFTPMANLSERDEHNGFHKIMLGAFEGVRNPKSHRMFSDLNEMTAAQYLVFISLLVRRVDECELVTQ